MFSPGGTYTIALKVTDNDGDSDVVTKNVVVANRPAHVQLRLLPDAPQKGETVNFTSLASDPENRIQSLEWDLDGDNQYDDAFGPPPSKVFDTPGNQTVRLRIPTARWIAHRHEDRAGDRQASGGVVQLQSRRSLSAQRVDVKVTRCSESGVSGLD